MRYVSVLVVVCVLSVGSSQSQDRVLIPLEPFDHSSVVCGCSFHEALSGAAEGSYGSGPEVFVIAPNANPPHALANTGQGNLPLRPLIPVEFPMYQCEVGEAFVSEWTSAEVAVLARLKVTGSGSEACRFSGNVHASAALGQAEIPVKGACGC
jgi:hypothetical protein